MRRNRATPELCPSPSRRFLLAGAGAALVAAPAIALPVVAHDSGDAELLATAARLAHIKTSKCTDDKSDAYSAECDRLETVLITTPATTVEGVAAKLAIAMAMSDDGFVHELDEDDELAALLSSIRTDLPLVHGPMQSVLALAVTGIEDSAKSTARMDELIGQNMRGAHQWRQQEAIFDRTGANKMLEVRRQKNAACPVNERGYTADEEGLASLFKKLDGVAQQNMLDFATLMLLADKARFAFEHLGDDFPTGKNTASVMRLIAADFAAAADRLDPPAEAA